MLLSPTLCVCVSLTLPLCTPALSCFRTPTIGIRAGLVELLWWTLKLLLHGYGMVSCFMSFREGLFCICDISLGKVILRILLVCAIGFVMVYNFASHTIFQIHLTDFELFYANWLYARKNYFFLSLKDKEAWWHIGCGLGIVFSFCWYMLKLMWSFIGVCGCVCRNNPDIMFIPI